MFFGSFDVFYACLKKCFYESVINMFFMFFICKLMFLASIRYVQRVNSRCQEQRRYAISQGFSRY